MQCARHKYYKGERPPRRSKNNPNGCPDCWKVFEGVRIEEERKINAPRKRTVKAVKAKLQSKLGGNAKKFQIESDDLNGEHAILYQGRCLYTATSLEEIEAFTMGFAEGRNYVVPEL